MKKIQLIFLPFVIAVNCYGLSLGNIQSEPGNISFISENKIVPDLKIQKELKTKPAWQDFIKKYGNWYVEFDELHKKPHRAFGPPVPIKISGDLETISRYFIETCLSGFNIQNQQLELVNVRSSKIHYIDFKQTFQGLEILNSRVTLRINNNNEVAMFGIDYFDDININLIPSISPKSIIKYADFGLSYEVNDVKVLPELKILPIPGDKKYAFYLVYEVYVTTYDHKTQMPGYYYSLIDANDGTVHYRYNQVHNSSNKTAKLEALVDLTDPTGPKGTVPIVDARVYSDQTLYYTDSLGEVSLPVGVDTITAYLHGKWARIVTGASGTTSPSIDEIVDTGMNTFSFNAITLSHRSAYYHVNVIHNFLKSKIPGFTGMDFAMTTRVDRNDGSCNAFYRGNEPSINFYNASGSCNSIARLGSVVYHEYGHGINYAYYSAFGRAFQNPSLGEGYSDVWSFGTTETPVIGKGFFYSGGGLRRYDQGKKVYPDDLTGESHDNGEIIAGCWWDIGDEFGSISQMMDLFVETLNGLAMATDGQEGVLFRDVLIDALIADDDDGNLNNGSPNDQLIACSFASHGINLLPDMDAAHTFKLNYTAKFDIPIEVDLSSSYKWYFNEVRLHYKTKKDDPWTDIDMTLGASGKYEATIPGQPVGTILKYYIEIANICGTSEEIPEGASNIQPNLPYVSLIGMEQKSIETFDNYGTDWVIGDIDDNATTGIWIIDEPVPSYSDPGNQIPENMVQTNNDHTQELMNICAVTGNASNASVQFGSQDIDDGKTTLFSPVFNLTSYTDPVFGYYRWYTNDQGSNPGSDYWEVYISISGENDWQKIEKTLVSDRSWRHNAFKVKDYFSSLLPVVLKFVASDYSPGSLVEAALDDLSLYDLDLTSGIDNKNHETDFQVYPNPATGIVNVYLSNGLTNFNQISIYNLMGEEVFLQNINTNNSNTIDMSNLPHGIYIIEAGGNNVIARKRVILLPE